MCCALDGLRHKLVSKLDSRGSVARWTWSIDIGKYCKSGVEGPGRYRVRPRGAVRACYNQMVKVSCFVSCTSACMRAIIPGTGTLDYCIISVGLI